MSSNKADKKLSIGQVAKELDIPSHVVRFWETKFPTHIQPAIGKGGRRYFYTKDLTILKKIKKFLYDEGYTIAGLQKLLKNKRKTVKGSDARIIISGNQEVAVEFKEKLVERIPGDKKKEITDRIKNVLRSCRKFEEICDLGTTGN